MYKSNSSLDLDHEVDILQESTVLTGAHSSGGQSRREYGSHGSLDMMGRGLTHGGEAVSGAALNGGMFAQPGDGPVAVSTLTRPGAQPGAHLDRSEDSAAGSVISTSSQDQEHGATQFIELHSDLCLEINILLVTLVVSLKLKIDGGVTDPHWPYGGYFAAVICSHDK